MATTNPDRLPAAARADRRGRAWRPARRSGPLWLALVLALQWAAAYGHCHALHAAALALLPGGAICTVHGDGKPPASPDAALADLDCPACHLAPAVEPAPPLLPAVRVAWHAAPPSSTREGLPVSGPRAPPPPARGPPSA